MQTSSTIAASAVMLGSLLLFAADSQLPSPNAAANTKNGPTVVGRPEGVNLQAPNGFEVKEYASGFGKPRVMLAVPGTSAVLVSDSLPKGAVYALTNNGHERKAIVEGVDRPYGLAIY